MFAKFTDHPHAVGETYADHAVTASNFGLELIAAGLACLVHAALPWTFETTASRRVRRLHAQMEGRRMPARQTAGGDDVLDFAI
ncbi:DUF6356 family protein [Phenylobacterium sp.]|uniref:DUF6356 family protein n=1 Tax=Phenylobacterium sp. TaxID=1871053 RepID=UPI0039831D28